MKFLDIFESESWQKKGQLGDTFLAFNFPKNKKAWQDILIKRGKTS